MLLTPREPASRSSPERAARGPLRIVVADDAVLLREGLVRLLAEDGHQVVAAVGDGPALVEAVLAHRPDVSVVDVRMPPTHTDEGISRYASFKSAASAPRPATSITPKRTVMRNVRRSSAASRSSLVTNSVMMKSLAASA